LRTACSVWGKQAVQTGEVAIGELELRSTADERDNAPKSEKGGNQGVAVERSPQAWKKKKTRVTRARTSGIWPRENVAGGMDATNETGEDAVPLWEGSGAFRWRGDIVKGRILINRSERVIRKKTTRWR